MNSFRIITIAFLIGSGLNSLGQPVQITGKKLRQYLEIQQIRMGFNGVVLITRNGQPVYSEAVGKASFELNSPLTIRSGFKIASISKSFTAMLVVLASREGKLGLNDPLAKFFPDINDTTWRKITIDQLLSHRSGIPHNEGIADYWSFRSLLPLSRQQALTEIFKMKLLFAPGTDVKYSSPGYFLLASILEEVYHRDYAAILKGEITGPLAMAHTGVYHTNALIPGMSSAYHILGDSLIVAPYRDFSLMKGSGDLYSDVEDLSRWTSSFGTGLWNKEVIAQVFSPRTDKGLHDNDDRYGYGWFIRPATQRVRAAYYVGGGTYGCSAITAWYPAEKITITILSNISVLPVNELWADIEKILFKEPFVLPSIKKTLTMTPEQLKKFAGLYNAEDPAMGLSITAEQDHLYAKLGSNPAFETYPYGAFTFYGKKVNIKFTFQADQEGIVTGLVADGRGKIITFSKK